MAATAFVNVQLQGRGAVVTGFIDPSGDGVSIQPVSFSLSIDTASTNDLGTGVKTKVTNAITTLFGVCSCKTSVVGPS